MLVVGNLLKHPFRGPVGSLGAARRSENFLDLCCKGCTLRVRERGEGDGEGGREGGREERECV